MVADDESEAAQVYLSHVKKGTKVLQTHATGFNTYIHSKMSVNLILKQSDSSSKFIRH